MKIFLMLLISLSITFSETVFAADLSLQIIVEPHTGKLHVLLVNSSGDTIRVNRGFSIAPLIGTLEFDITHQGKAMALQALVNPRTVDQSFYVDLSPGEISGHVFGINHVSQLYGLRAGYYELSVKYEDNSASKYRAIAGVFLSKPIRLCVDDKGEVGGDPSGISDGKQAPDQSN